MKLEGIRFTMAVVSMSLPDDLLQEMDAVAGKRGRSGFARAALRAHLSRKIPAGHLHGSITLAYDHGHEARISEVRHAFHDVVLSLMHTHCEPEVCMDVLLVGGPSARIVALMRLLEGMREVRRAVLVPAFG